MLGEASGELDLRLARVLLQAAPLVTTHTEEDNDRHHDQQDDQQHHAHHHQASDQRPVQTRRRYENPALIRPGNGHSIADLRVEPLERPAAHFVGTIDVYGSAVFRFQSNLDRDLLVVGGEHILRLDEEEGTAGCGRGAVLGNSGAIGSRFKGRASISEHLHVEDERSCQVASIYHQSMAGEVGNKQVKL